MPTDPPSAEPLPSGHSANRNRHVLVRPSPEVLLLEPGQSLLRNCVIFLCLVPVSTLLSLPFGNWQVTMVAILAPLLPCAGAALAFYCFYREGTRVHFDMTSSTVTITGGARGRGSTFPIASVAAVQITHPREITGVDAGWTSYQLNLELKEGEPGRVTLLDNGGLESLRAISAEIAEFLRVPLRDYSAGGE